MKHPLPDQLKPLFVILDIRALWRSGPEMPTVDRPTSTHAAFHGPTHGSAIGASQPLDHSSGTVCQPGFVSPTTTSENFVGSWSRFCSSDTAAQWLFVLMRLLNTLTHSLTHSLTPKVIGVEKNSVYHTVNGNRALFHTSKTAKMIKVILRASCQNVNVLVSNITFIIFAVFDVKQCTIAVNSVINWSILLFFYNSKQYFRFWKWSDNI